ncbi:FMN reductase [candidate division MSBL1 archaeon SCGC-AAA259E17]|uniref:FMN reductase n=1 Tax=candidate division MSBL1 archaeon SCGC-AAA259E17 TaxID=1698263 RepID=A0A133UF38_9EURY|nr:FMN reductase [candidate division MSBL1 archaeon SCGC-AAA259E17]
MKVTAFNGSPRKDGNTSTLIDQVFEELKKEDIDCEKVQIGGRNIHGCTACMECRENKDMKCVIEDDIINDCIRKMDSSDGIIIASPTYYSDLTPEIKALIDRAGYVSGASDNFLRRKVGAPIAAVRRAGAMHVLDSITHFFLINEMIIAGSSYWNLGIGRKKGEIKQDEEGMRTMKDLGKNMAWLLEKAQE